MFLSRYVIFIFAVSSLTNSSAVRADLYLNAEEALSSQKRGSCENKLQINFFGDVYVDSTRIQENRDVFQNVTSLLREADANIINLEGSITEHQEREFPKQQFSLKNASWLPKKLKSSGIRYVTLANNHTMDFGKIGLNDTLRILDSYGIQYGGAGKDLNDALKPININFSGIRVSILSFATTIPSGSWANEKRAGIAYPTKKILTASISEAKKKSDFIVVSFHWGKEGSTTLRDHQKYLGHLAVDLGASLVLGHHAHIAQPIEFFKGVPIFYGLGNFVFSSLTPTPVLSLGLHTLFCKNRAQNHKYLLWAISPLNTLNGITGYQTQVHNPKEFYRLASYYVAQKLWPVSMPIVLGVPDPILPHGESWVSPLAAIGN